MHCGILEGELNSFIFKNQTSLSCSCCGLFCSCFLVISLHCGLLASESNELFSFKTEPSYLVHFVVCLYHIVLLVSIMHCGLLEGEFNAFLICKSNLPILFF